MAYAKKIHSLEDIPEKLRNTPVADLLSYHNLGARFKQYDKADLLIGMCMDNRKQLRIPDKFAYIIRAGGANLRYSEFKVSYAIAIGGVRFIALMGHTQCGMVNLASRRDSFVEGMVKNAGWTQQRALEHFQNFAPLFEIDNEILFTLAEAQRLNQKYPGVTTIPLLYKVEDNLIYLIEE
ncbi:MAG: carbonic anhydrase [Bacteroidales bacterium]|jgi:carbonic anhydrase|nr:carbonic anhydrase [Bacteroidales bacterium]MDN5330488.1 carbonic anhydrase [Bacteroidales bacterium]